MSTQPKTALAALACLSLAGTVSSAVQVPRWFGDNMVFQTNAEYGARSFLNGKARPGEHVNVKFTPGGNFPAVADASGDWEVQFNGGGVGHGPGTVTVTGEDGPPLVAQNVMGGDVYFCSGQVSNRAPALPLQLPVSHCLGS